MSPFPPRKEIVVKNTPLNYQMGYFSFCVSDEV